MFSLAETVYFTLEFFQLAEAETVTGMSGNQFLKKALFSLVETGFVARENHFLPLSQIFFMESFIPASENTFQSKRKSIAFYLELSFLLVETII